MVSVKKFSEFLDAGTFEGGNVPVGLEGGVNAFWTAPLQFTASFTTATRPASPSNPTIGYNTDINQFEYWDGTLWQQLASSGDIADLLALLASHTAGEGASLIGLENQGSVLNKTVQDMAEEKFIVQTNSGSLANAQALGSLTTGIMKSTTGTGVVSIAIPGTDYALPRTWYVVNSATNLAANSGYVVDHGSGVTLTLPVTAAVGADFIIAGYDVGLFTIAQNASQFIRLGNSVSTTGGAGTVVSTLQGDVLRLTCVEANVGFMATALVGNFNLT